VKKIRKAVLLHEFIFFSIRLSRNMDFGIPLGIPPPKGETLCPGTICTIVQTFAPIGGTVAEISVPEQIHRITADLVSNKTHTGTGVCR